VILGAVMDMVETRRAVLQRSGSIRGSGLEIGAYARPTVEPGGCEMFYLDYYSTEELRAQAISGGYENPDNIIPVDFVCKSEDYRGAIDRKFDLVIANHVMEHIVEPIRWLQMLSEFINPGGHLFLTLPDKKYSFDRYRKDSDLADILYDYFSPRPASEKAERFALQAAIYYDHAYIGGVMDANHLLSEDRLVAEMKQHHAGIHCHVFQGETFLNKILMPLIRMKLIDFSLVYFQPSSPFGEFYTVLKRGWSPVELDTEKFYTAETPR
jgi:predicted SAM-dependent methyltransferase